MLEELRARDLALIGEAWIELGRGMTVLTGETGAGKTVLLNALKLLLGERADATAVRSGAAEAVVEGRFRTGEVEVLVKRRVSSDGRSRCTLDGEMATVGAVAERTGPLVDLHGQHEHQALLTSSTHAGYLDRWAGPPATGALADYRKALDDWHEARDTLAELEARIVRAREDADRLRFTLAEIDAVDPREGEDEELRVRLPALQHAERLSEAADSVVEALRGEGGALDHVAGSAAALARVAGIDPALDGLAARLAEVEALIDDVGTAVRTYRDGVEHEPAALEAVHERLAALNGLVRRFGPTLSDVMAKRTEAGEILAAIDGETDGVSRAKMNEQERRATLERAAAALSQVRAEAAPSFTEALAREAADLAMPGARFEVALEDLAFDAWSRDGSQRVEFKYSPAAGQEARPLARIASGGEVSRVMLALKGVLGSADSVSTLVFDEVDAGIGGATASAVGARLARLARSHQVIVVTHLAQVAVFADAHFVVRKLVDGDSVETTVVPVEAEDRMAEVARMLSGAVSETSMAHAAELLSAAADAVSEYAEG